MTSVSSAARRGFTLIELLVVIAIIGILSSVVLASLNTARNKGADASVKSNLGEARAQAELFYDANGNRYVVTAGGTTDVCSTTALVGGVKGIAASVSAAASAAGASYTGTLTSPSSATVAACHAAADGSAWAASAPLKATTGTYYCVDSTGNATSTTSVLAASATVCS
ncbi:MAG: hypothetical protein AB202_01750 [Parcubacteria bacterium C7867-007]|nr:MAG: hypothetical protein AB202_01750 [Parcubacteria bacterium C7867-007]